MKLPDVEPLFPEQQKYRFFLSSGPILAPELYTVCFLILSTYFLSFLDRVASWWASALLAFLLASLQQRYTQTDIVQSSTAWDKSFIRLISCGWAAGCEYVFKFFIYLPS